MLTESENPHVVLNSDLLPPSAPCPLTKPMMPFMGVLVQARRLAAKPPDLYFSPCGGNRRRRGEGRGVQAFSLLLAGGNLSMSTGPEHTWASAHMGRHFTRECRGTRRFVRHPGKKQRRYSHTLIGGAQDIIRLIVFSPGWKLGRFLANQGGTGIILCMRGGGRQPLLANLGGTGRFGREHCRL